MTDREKLIDLAHDYFKSVPWYADIADLNPEELIDHLLANGVRLESKQATSDENKRWIPVSERLPDKQHDWVLVACKLHPEGFYGVPHIGELRNGVWWCDCYEVPLKDAGVEVTHWMPLPNPPKEDN